MEFWGHHCHCQALRRSRAQAAEEMRITPYCTLEIISGFLSYEETIKWLAAARGNVETRILREESLLSAAASEQFEDHEAYLAALDMENRDTYECLFDFVEVRDEMHEHLDQREREEEEEELDRRAFGFGGGRRRELDYDSDTDHEYQLWKRWAGDD